MAHRQLRIAIAEGNPTALCQTRQALTNLGHEVVAEVATASSLVHGLDEIDLIIADISSVNDGDVHAIASLLEIREAPLVVTSSSATDDVIDTADACRPFAHLIKPIGEPNLKVAISLAIQRFEELQGLRAEASSLRQALADRKIIEQAKGVVMRECNLEESEAFKHIQRLAREKRLPLCEIAKSIITAEPAFRMRNANPPHI